MNGNPDVILHEKATGNWLFFSSPVKIITADHLDEVMPALKKVENAVLRQHLHAAGFISYEAARAFDQVMTTKERGHLPLLWFGLYSQMETSNTLLQPTGGYALGDWQPSISKDDYYEAISRIKALIGLGKTYQVNFTFRLRNTFTGNPRSLFYDLVQAQTSGYSAFVDIGSHAICSASPELFFKLQGKLITCRPMKGTTQRGRTLKDDLEQAALLKQSIKNCAENVMIVDMIRNDLGQTAEMGSVHVQELFSLEKYPSLWQMTSSITAKTGASFTEILKTLFPCASITGAPKISTMEIINSLETTPRQIYTGTIGYLSPGRKAQFNVAIRTVLIENKTGQAEYGTGGGIVWDSLPGDEFAEALLKARLLTAQKKVFSLLETMRWSPKEGFYLLEYHLDRLEDSAHYFDFPFERTKIEDYLQKTASHLPHATQRFRLLLDPNGTPRHETAPIEIKPQQRELEIRIANQPIHTSDIFLYHKTTNRQVYEKIRQEHPGCDDVILFNERSEITETTIANLVFQINNQMFTPPITCGLLGGTFRRHLLEQNVIREKIITLKDLPQAENMYLINSVRGWQKAKLCG